jgi:hypothetical protein
VTSDRKTKAAARERAAREKIPYIQARAIEDAIARLMAERGLDREAAAELDGRARDLMDRDEEFETYDDALAWLDDPANEVMCDTCGWTWGMVCPECDKGCGCETRCTGWRHKDWSNSGDDEDMDDRWECEECGGGDDAYTGCQCA